MSLEETIQIGDTEVDVRLTGKQYSLPPIVLSSSTGSARLRTYASVEEARALATALNAAARLVEGLEAQERAAMDLSGVLEGSRLGQEES